MPGYLSMFERITSATHEAHKTPRQQSSVAQPDASAPPGYDPRLLASFRTDRAAAAPTWPRREV